MQEAFLKTLQQIGGWEPEPRLAVAVSGGPDSMALCLLAHEWAVQRGGTVVGVTVDHGLRAESAAEAAQVGQWLAAHAIPHAVLRWEGEKPASGLQQAARAARYGLLETYCRTQSILHLLLGHQAEDQAETFWQRLAHGSGPEGLAGMAMVREAADVRYLRPLLNVPKAALEHYLRARGQGWLVDPGNETPVFQRGRLRQALQTEGLGPERLKDVMRKMGEARVARETIFLRALVDCLSPVEEGLWLALTPFRAMEPWVQRKLLAAAVMHVGGGAMPPREEKLRRLQQALMAQAFTRASLQGAEFHAGGKKRAGFIMIAATGSAGKGVFPHAPLAEKGAMPHISGNEMRAAVSRRPLSESLFVPMTDAEESAGEKPRE